MQNYEIQRVHPVKEHGGLRCVVWCICVFTKSDYKFLTFFYDWEQLPCILYEAMLHIVLKSTVFQL